MIPPTTELLALHEYGNIFIYTESLTKVFFFFTFWKCVRVHEECDAL